MVQDEELNLTNYNRFDLKTFNKCFRTDFKTLETVFKEVKAIFSQEYVFDDEEEENTYYFLLDNEIYILQDECFILDDFYKLEIKKASEFLETVLETLILKNPQTHLLFDEIKITRIEYRTHQEDILKRINFELYSPLIAKAYFDKLEELNQEEELTQMKVYYEALAHNQKFNSYIEM